MQDLALNLNVTRGMMILDAVEDATTVSRAYLLEDSGFCKLIHQCAHNQDTVKGINLCVEYVNNNF